MVDLVLKLSGNKKYFSNPKKFLKKVENASKLGDIHLPNYKFKLPMDIIKVDNYNVYHIGNNKKDKVIIYLHGGAYISPGEYYHYRFIENISRICNIDIYDLDYPLLPKHTYKDAYDVLEKLYDLLSDKEVIIMGDSAGGGFTLGFTMYLKELKKKLASKLVLVSPWVDVTMSNPDIKKFEKTDHMTSTYGLVECGKMWASDIDRKDYRISPLYGDFKGLPDILMFTGTNELLYPDLVKLNMMMLMNKVNVRLIQGYKQGHIYPLYPNKIGEKAVNQINEFIK